MTNSTPSQPKSAARIHDITHTAMSRSKAAKICKVNARTIDRAISAGTIACTRFGPSLMLDNADVAAFKATIAEKQTVIRRRKAIVAKLSSLKSHPSR